MYLGYVDESGNAGDVAKGGSKSYTLGCILVRASQWAATFDGLIGYRRYLKARFGLLMHAEVKANYLLQNGGAFRGLAMSERARHSLYRGLLRLCPKLDLKAFAIVIRKELVTVGEPQDLAWMLLLQRLEQLTAKQDTQVVIFHDEGDDMRVRALARGFQCADIVSSALGAGQIRVPFRGLLDDPVPRRSHESLFLQLSDLVAYAAFRRVFPPPERGVQIVPELMWNELGTSTLTEVSDGSGGPSPGIVVWPWPK